MNQPGDGVRPYLRVSADGPVSVQTANWNDNWLAFASGNVKPTLSVTLDGPVIENCGTIMTYDVEVTNVGEEPVVLTGIETDSFGNLDVTEVATLPVEGGAGIGLEPGDSVPSVQCFEQLLNCKYG